jgi:hypothetical protein
MTESNRRDSTIRSTDVLLEFNRIDREARRERAAVMGEMIASGIMSIVGLARRLARGLRSKRPQPAARPGRAAA